MLPKDLITTISFFLNEQDIFEFELCCNLFHKMVNNKSYLTKSNNFKRFEITNKRLNQMTQYPSRCGLYKYCKAKDLTLKIDLAAVETRSTAWKHCLTKLKKQWQKAQSEVVATDDHDNTNVNSEKYNWTTSLFKSIKRLQFHNDSIYFLDNIPLDILFDPQYKSDLETLVFQQNFASRDQDELLNSTNGLEKEYLKLNNRLRKTNVEIKTLKSLHFVGFGNVIALPFIKTKGIVFNAPFLCIGAQILAESTYPPRILTIIGDWNSPLPYIQKYQNQLMSNCQIDTLKLIKYANKNFDLCLNEEIIESLNLDKNLSNLKIDFTFFENDDGDDKKCFHLNFDYGLPAIEAVLTKKYFHNLKNVNILLHFGSSIHVEKFFKLLTKHVKLLKYQFECLNISLHICDDNNCNIETCNAFEWNSQIDEKWLTKMHQKCVQLKAGAKQMRCVQK